MFRGELLVSGSVYMRLRSKILSTWTNQQLYVVWLWIPFLWLQSFTTCWLGASWPFHEDGGYIVSSIELLTVSDWYKECPYHYNHFLNDNVKSYDVRCGRPNWWGGILLSIYCDTVDGSEIPFPTTWDVYNPIYHITWWTPDFWTIHSISGKSFVFFQCGQMKLEQWAGKGWLAMIVIYRGNGFSQDILGRKILYTPPKQIWNLKMGAPWKFGDSYWKFHHFQVPCWILGV